MSVTARARIPLWREGRVVLARQARQRDPVVAHSRGETKFRALAAALGSTAPGRTAIAA